MRRGDHIEPRRVLAAHAAGLTLAIAAVYACLFTYAAGQLDLKADFSYYRTARPSESTKKIASSLQDQVKVIIFFPSVSEVGQEVYSYLSELGRSCPKFVYESHDRLLEPALANEWKVTEDGVVVLARGATLEMMNVGIDLESARERLKMLDVDFQAKLLKVSRAMRRAYWTVGHGELNEAGAGAGTRSANLLRKKLESEGYIMNDLDLGLSSKSEVPKDGGFVAVLGPSRGLSPGEVATLEKYAHEGGHLLLALDPDARIDLDSLAAIAGLTYDPTLLVNETQHMRGRSNDTDRRILVTNKFSSHASVTTLSRNENRAFVIFAGAGALERRADSAFPTDFAIKAHGNTFADTNGDFQLQAGEKKDSYNLAAAVSTAVPADSKVNTAESGMRIFVLSDADVMSDAQFENAHNVTLVVDAVRWLAGEESSSAATSTTEDVGVEHTKQGDLMFFYGTIVLIPTLVLGGGLFSVRRARKKPIAARSVGARLPEERVI
jgi:hypothetical protein